MVPVLGLFYRSHVLDCTLDFIHLTLCPVSIMNTVFIDRGKSAKSQSVLHEAARTIRETGVKNGFHISALELRSDGGADFAFAAKHTGLSEGHRLYFTTPDLLDFKKGTFHLVIQVRLPMVPIVIGNYSDALEKNVTRFRSGTILVRDLMLSKCTFHTPLKAMIYKD
jgi:1-acyl-sn-glycerol-3-phosphate acyltransferase